MRVLVTRPSDQAARHGETPRRAGPSAVSRRSSKSSRRARCPKGRSTSSWRPAPRLSQASSPPPACRAVPLFCVGEKTAEAGQGAGLSRPFVAPRAEACRAELAEGKYAEVRALPRGTRAQGLSGRRLARGRLASTSSKPMTRGRSRPGRRTSGRRWTTATSSRPALFAAQRGGWRSATDRTRRGVASYAMSAFPPDIAVDLPRLGAGGKNLPGFSTGRRIVNHALRFRESRRE